MMAIPGEMHAPGGIPKGLLRAAMRGIVPDPVLDRRWKADYTHVVNHEVNRNYAELIDYLESSGKAMDMGFLERSMLKKKLGSLKAGLQKSNCLAAWCLSDLVGLELWLETFHSSRKTGDSFSR